MAFGTNMEVSIEDAGPLEGYDTLSLGDCTWEEWLAKPKVTGTPVGKLLSPELKGRLDSPNPADYFDWLSDPVEPHENYTWMARISGPEQKAQMIGCCSIKLIRDPNGMLNAFQAINWYQDSWGKGVAFTAGRMALYDAFAVRDLPYVTGAQYAHNARAFKAAENIGLLNSPLESKPARHPPLGYSDARVKIVRAFNPRIARPDSDLPHYPEQYTGWSIVEQGLVWGEQNIRFPT